MYQNEANHIIVEYLYNCKITIWKFIFIIILSVRLIVQSKMRCYPKN